MITDEERKSIINEAVNKAVERAMLSLPEVVGNLLASNAALNKINSKFYSEHPEFKDNKNVVASVIEMVEGRNPLDSYEEILKRSIPEIRNRLEVMKGLNMKNIPKEMEINRDFKSLSIPKVSNNGEL